MIALIDNNDSFTYNLVQIFEEIGADIIVINSNDLEIRDIEKFSAIVISPGPELPENYPKMTEVIDTYHQKVPILGICLGHQAIAEYFGAELFRTNLVQHGIKSEIYISKNNVIFDGLIEPVYVGRYHSWAVKETIPECLEITSKTKDGIIMSLSHKKYNIKGLQFHPESIITIQGFQMLQNWCKSIK
jgi:anthranilate synthase component 2